MCAFRWFERTDKIYRDIVGVVGALFDSFTSPPEPGAPPISELFSEFAQIRLALAKQKLGLYLTSIGANERVNLKDYPDLKEVRVDQSQNAVFQFPEEVVLPEPGNDWVLRGDRANARSENDDRELWQLDFQPQWNGETVSKRQMAPSNESDLVAHVPFELHEWLSTAVRSFQPNITEEQREHQAELSLGAGSQKPQALSAVNLETLNRLHKPQALTESNIKSHNSLVAQQNSRQEEAEGTQPSARPGAQPSVRPGAGMRGGGPVEEAVRANDVQATVPPSMSAAKHISPLSAAHEFLQKFKAKRVGAGGRSNQSGGTGAGSNKSDGT